jgi:hypothetical protein
MDPGQQGWRVSASQDVNHEVRRLDGLFDWERRGFLDACGGAGSRKRHVVTKAVLWLCSPAASFLDGTAVPVVGGFLAA